MEAPGNVGIEGENNCEILEREGRDLFAVTFSNLFFRFWFRDLNIPTSGHKLISITLKIFLSVSRHFIF
jgi:hypothetical protein